MKRRGTGVGCMFYGVGNTGLPNPAAAFVEVLPDCSVNVTVGAADIGQGSSTMAAMVAAEALGLNYEDMHVVWADTMVAPEGGATSASRQTRGKCPAIYNHPHKRWSHWVAIHKVKHQSPIITTTTLRKGEEDIEGMRTQSRRRACSRPSVCHAWQYIGHIGYNIRMTYKKKPILPAKIACRIVGIALLCQCKLHSRIILLTYLPNLLGRGVKGRKHKRQPKNNTHTNLSHSG